MLMTACDLNGTTKPWDIQKGVSLSSFAVTFLYWRHVGLHPLILLLIHLVTSGGAVGDERVLSAR